MANYRRMKATRRKDHPRTRRSRGKVTNANSPLTTTLTVLIIVGIGVGLVGVSVGGGPGDDPWVYVRLLGVLCIGLAVALFWAIRNRGTSKVEPFSAVHVLRDYINSTSASPAERATAIHALTELNGSLHARTEAYYARTGLASLIDIFGLTHRHRQLLDVDEALNRDWRMIGHDLYTTCANESARAALR